MNSDCRQLLGFGWASPNAPIRRAGVEIAQRCQRRIARNLAEAHLLPGKTLDNFDFAVVPMLSKAPKRRAAA